MKPLSTAGALALALAAAACGDNGTTVQNGQGSVAGQAASTATYSAVGTVTAIAGDRVTISHGPVAGLGWPAMTMTFRAGDSALLQGVSVGDRVAFQFRKEGNDFPLAAMRKAP